jgi:hypothetical protein
MMGFYILTKFEIEHDNRYYFFRNTFYFLDFANSQSILWTCFALMLCILVTIIIFPNLHKHKRSQTYLFGYWHSTFILYYR